MTVSQQSANDLFHALLRVQKLFIAARSTAPRVHPGVDAAAYPILFVLARDPERVSTIADLIHSDVSTVSRHVAHLERHALVSKEADPEDGRAQVVSLSAEGRDVLRTIQTKRSEWFQRMLTDWDNEGVEAFSHQLEALADLLDQSLRNRGQALPPGRIDLITEKD
ncbi:MAG: MarR family transcriptional regulator [Dermatophilaceae bacterium]